jgi:HEAT repeat protein
MPLKMAFAAGTLVLLSACQPSPSTNHPTQQDKRLTRTLRSIKKATLSKLKYHANDPHKRIQQEAIQELGRRGTKALPALQALLQHKRHTIREQAIAAIESINPPAYSALLQATNNTHATVRLLAANALYTRRPIPARFTKTLLSGIRQHRDPKVQLFFSKIICHAGTSARTALLNELHTQLSGHATNRKLAQILRSPTARAPWNRVFRLLGCIPALSQKQQVTLAKISQKASVLQQFQIMSYLRKQQTNAEKAWVQLLKQAPPPRQQHIIDVLNQTRPFPTTTLASFIWKLTAPTNNSAIRWRATTWCGLWKPTPKKTTRLLVAYLKDKDPKVVQSAMVSLGRLSYPLASLLPHMKALMADPSPIKRAAVALAAAHYKTEHKPLMTLLTQSLQDRADVVQAAALQALGVWGQQGNPQAVLALSGAFGHTSADHRREAAKALAHIKTAYSIGIKALAKALTDKNTTVRQYAARSLKALKLQAAPALPALRLAEKKEADYLTKMRMQQAIMAIQQALQKGK